MSDASQICPDNIAIKAILNEKISEFESTEKIESAEDNAVLGYAYYSIGEQTKAIKYSEEALLKDNTNKKAKGVIELAKTRNLIKEPPQINNKERFQLELDKKIKTLEENPNIDINQIKKLKADIKNERDLLKVKSDQINRQ